jgi:hypothetical protein
MANANSHAIFACDPGLTTGAAWGVFDLRQPTVGACMRRALSKGNVFSSEVSGEYVEQAWRLARKSADWFYSMHVERSWIREGEYSFVMESFSPRSMGVELISMQIIAGVEVLMRGAYNATTDEYKRYCVQQTASEAKGFCSDDMLRDWNMYKGRSKHERDALRHIARRIDKLLNQ